jgi:predicted N-acetyltransferase YhbS
MITIRSASAEDAEAAGQICHDAFAAIAEAHNFAKDFPSPGEAAGFLAMLIGKPGVFARVAEDDGRLVGSNFLDERGPIFGIGPITIDPAGQNSGSGRRLMEDALQRVAERGAPGVRLLQDAYHVRSFALYASLGFEVQEATAIMQGVPPDWVDPATTVRAAGEGDLDDCTALCVRVHGHPRRVELADAIEHGGAQVVERGGRITGYTTGVGFIGHSVGETNADVQMLISTASEYFGPGFHCPTSNGPLVSWCIQHGLRIGKIMTLMTVGLYHRPRGAFLPSVIY